MKTLEDIKQKLAQSKALLRENYRITQVGIFGSYARGEQTEQSDVDVLIDYEQAPILFKTGRASQLLERVDGNEGGCGDEERSETQNPRSRVVRSDLPLTKRSRLEFLQAIQGGNEG